MTKYLYPHLKWHSPCTEKCFQMQRSISHTTAFSLAPPALDLTSTLVILTWRPELNIFWIEPSKQYLWTKGEKIKKYISFIIIHLLPHWKKTKTWQIIPDRDLSMLKTSVNHWEGSPSSNMLAAAVCSRSRSLLPAFLVVVVILWSAAGGWPLGAAVVLGLLQELVQTEGILFKLDWPFPPLTVVGTWELFVWNKPGGRQEKKKRSLKWEANLVSPTDLEVTKLLLLCCACFLSFRCPWRRKEDKVFKLQADLFLVQQIFNKKEHRTGSKKNNHQDTSCNLCFYVSENLLKPKKKMFLSMFCRVV